MASRLAASNDRYNLFILYISYLIQQFIEGLCVRLRKICHDCVHLVAVLVDLFQELSSFCRDHDVDQPAVFAIGRFPDKPFFQQAIDDSAGQPLSVLMIDGPGQGGTLRRHKVPTRHDYEVPIGRSMICGSR